MVFNISGGTVTVSFSRDIFERLKQFFVKHATVFLVIVLSLFSVASFIIYYVAGLGIAYNDAMSHLDIGRRVVEGLKPGFAQLGSVWLPLPHLLMTLTIWNDFMWHSGLSGAVVSMISYVATGILIYLFLKLLNVGLFGRIFGVVVFALNINILYMQSTAMTELLLLATMTAGVYELTLWHKEESLFRLIKAAFWIMLSTLVRYDGWFLFAFSILLILWHTFRKKGYKATEGTLLLFSTLGGFGIFLWLLWNQMIFKDALYFAFGPFSAHAQQEVLAQTGELNTKHNLLLSVGSYLYAMAYNAGLYTLLLGIIGSVLLWLDKNIDARIRFGLLALLAPFFFNVLALYLGHSVLFIQGFNANRWFNVRYGLMMMPSVAVFAGYLVHRFRSLRFVLIGLFLFVTFFTYINYDAVTIDDQKSGKSGRNVSEVSQYLHDQATHHNGYILMAASANDSIMFSADLPMSRFIHEGTGLYWDLATAHPERWVRWVVFYKGNTDLAYTLLSHNNEFKDYYYLAHKFPYAEIYELKPQLTGDLQPLPKIAQNK